MRSEYIEQLGNVVYLEKKRINNSGSRPAFWAVASGKGGVGRSFFISSLGITLSRLGYRVLMVDCDSNGGSLHSCFGVFEKNKSISDYFKNIDEIENYFTNIGFEKLRLLSGNTCLWNCETESVRNVSDLLLELRSQPFDIIMFDLSSGCNDENSVYLKEMDEIFLITTPEATSIEKSYRWIENYILKIAIKKENKEHLCEFNQKRKMSPAMNSSLFEVRNFLENLRAGEFQNQSDLRPFGPIRLVVNQVRNFEDEKLGDSIKSICNKFYYTEIQPVGYLQYDNAVWQCARQRVPVIVHQPFNPLVGQIQSLVKQIVDQTTQKAVV